MTRSVTANEIGQMALFRRQRGRFIPPETRPTLHWPWYVLLSTFSASESRFRRPRKKNSPRPLFCCSQFFRFVALRGVSPFPTSIDGRFCLLYRREWTVEFILLRTNTGVVNATIINSPKIPPTRESKREERRSYEISALFFGFLVLSSPRLRINER